MRVFGSWFRLADEDAIKPIKRQAKRQRTDAAPAQSRPPAGSGARDLPCSKGCGRRFGWPPARVSHEKLCAGGAAAADDATSSHACTAVAVWCTDRPRPALQLTLALALALTLTRCTDRPRPALQLSDGMDEVRATPTSLEPYPQP